MKLKYRQARLLRKALTAPEFLLWERLKTRHPEGPVFRRQCAFGPYSLDFYCVRAKLAVEVDGHDHTRDEAIRHDAVRDAFVKSFGVMTYRIPVPEIFRNLDSVADGVWDLALARMNGN